jgi:hypothetical protein
MWGKQVTKSGIACEFSIKALLKDHKIAYLWTFTFAEVLPEDVAAWMWSRLAQDLRRQVGFYGVRCFELHPGGHGLHIHFVTPRRYDVNHVRHYSDLHGFGRINVKRMPASAAGYIAKYLQKASRCPALKGKRLWSCVGFKEGSKVKNIVIDSPITREIKKISDDDLFRIVGSDCWRINVEESPFLKKLVQPDSYRLRNHLKFLIAMERVTSSSVRLVASEDPATGLPITRIVPREINGLLGRCVVFPSRSHAEYNGGVDWERLAIIYENSKVDGIHGRDEILAAFEKLSSGRTINVSHRPDCACR